MLRRRPACSLGDCRQSSCDHAWKIINDLVSLIDLTTTTLALAGGEVPKYHEGRNLFAPGLQAAEYVVGARDRCDYTIDMSRTIRTEKMRYIRNYHTDRIMLQSQYRDNAPYTQEMWKLHREEKLDSYQEAHWFGVRPLEELYDLESDPHQIRNLATDPKHRSDLFKHRKMLDDWSTRTDDQGMYAESTEQLRATFDFWNKNPKFKKLELNPEYDAFR